MFLLSRYAEEIFWFSLFPILQYDKPYTPQKITFKYLKNVLQNGVKQIERYGGAIYKVSPYQLLMNDGNYYLLAFDDKSQEIRTYRIDRMKEVEAINEPRDGAEAFKEIEMETYTRRVFSMFDGVQRRVSIRFTNSKLDTIVERFGTGHDVFYMPEGDHHFIVSADIEISDQFYSWVCGFRKAAVILSPPDVVEGMEKFLKDIASCYKVAET